MAGLSLIRRTRRQQQLSPVRRLARPPAYADCRPTYLPVRLALVVALLALLAVLARFVPLLLVAPVVLVILDLASLNLLYRGLRSVWLKPTPVPGPENTSA